MPDEKINIRINNKIIPFKLKTNYKIRKDVVFLVPELKDQGFIQEKLNLRDRPDRKD